MSSEGRRDNETQATPVYTIYPVPGGNAGNFNYGLHYNNPCAPPPKYEEVVDGTPGAPVPPPQLCGNYDVHEQQGVVFVTPVYKPSSIQRSLAVIFSILFAVFFTAILVKMLRF